MILAVVLVSCIISGSGAGEQSHNTTGISLLFIDSYIQTFLITSSGNKHKSSSRPERLLQGRGAYDLFARKLSEIWFTSSRRACQRLHRGSYQRHSQSLRQRFLHHSRCVLQCQVAGWETTVNFLQIIFKQIYFWTRSYRRQVQYDCCQRQYSSQTLDSRSGDHGPDVIRDSQNSVKTWR